MMMGLGDTTTPAVSAAPTFSDGLSLWKNPLGGLMAVGTVIQTASTAFQTAVLPFTMGVLIVPAALVAVLFSMGGKKR